MPKYLSFDGPVRNRRLGKRDTLLLIRDIWREKAASDAEVRILGSRFLQQLGGWGGGGGVGILCYSGQDFFHEKCGLISEWKLTQP